MSGNNIVVEDLPPLKAKGPKVLRKEDRGGQGSSVNRVGQTGSEASAMGNIDSAMRAARYKAAKANAKVRKYEKKYPSMKSPSDEFTKQQEKLDIGFIPPELKVDENRAVGSGAIFKTSILAKDDKERIQLGKPAKGVISNKWTTYGSEEIIIVDLKEADQYFSNLDIYDKENKAREFGGLSNQAVGDMFAKGNILFKLPFLRSVTGFCPLLPPPHDKNFSDYLQDLREYQVANKSTSINQALGQATYRAMMTIKQASLNHAFYLVDSQYFPMSTKQDAEPMTTAENPRIAMFYKKFLSTDPTWEETIPGGPDLYDNRLCGTKEEIDKLMKTYASSVTFGERLKSYGMVLENEGLNLAFQNLQISDDVHEMIKHTMASVYVNLITSICDAYLSAGKWFDSCLIGSLAGFPPGLIMPCHLYYMMEDRMARDTADEGNTQRRLLSHWQTNLPILRAINNMRDAFLTPFNGGNPEPNSRLYKDGYEWLNGQTPGKTLLVSDRNFNSNTINLEAEKTGDMKMTQHWFEGQINATGFPFSLAAKDREDRDIVSVSALSSAQTVIQNRLIMDSIEKYIGQNLKPTGTQIFQTWGLDESAIMKSDLVSTKQYMARDKGNLMQKSLRKNNRMRDNTFLRQGSQGTVSGLGGVAGKGYPRK